MAENVTDHVSEYFQSLLASIAVLRRISDSQHKLPITGEKKVQVFKVALEATASCLVIVHSRRGASSGSTRHSKRSPQELYSDSNELYLNTVKYLGAIFESTRAIGIDALQLSIRSVKFFYEHLGGQVAFTGMKLLWCFDELLSNGEQITEALGLFGHVCRLALMCHCLEFHQSYPLSSGEAFLPQKSSSASTFLPLGGTVTGFSSFQSSAPNPSASLTVMVESFLAIISQNPPSPELVQRSAHFLSGLGKLSQRSVYLVADLLEGGEVKPTTEFFGQLSFILSFACQLGWLVREHEIGYEASQAISVFSNHSSSSIVKLPGRQRPSNPTISAGDNPNSWRASKLNVEVVLEFLLQKDDVMGRAGFALAKRFLSFSKGWKLISSSSHREYSLQLSLLVLRIIAPLCSPSTGLSVDSPFTDDLLSTFELCLKLSLKADDQPSIQNVESGKPTLRAVAEGNKFQQSYLSSRRGVKASYNSSYQKRVVETVVSVAPSLFQFVAQIIRDSDVMKHIRTVCFCFARIGSGDVHWAAVFGTSSRGWASENSEFEIPAAVLRCAIHGLLVLHRPQESDDFEVPMDRFVTGVLAALHHLNKGNVVSFQDQIYRSKRFEFSLASSGEYSISLFASRVVALLQQHSRDVAEESPNASRFAILLPILTQRSCNACLVFQLPIETLLAWVPCIAVALGDTREIIGRAGGLGLLELVKCITVRKSIEGLSSLAENLDSPVSRSSSASLNNDELKEKRGFLLDLVFLRLQEVWHAIFVTGELPQWMFHPSGNTELDPSPFSAVYAKDLMHMLTQQKKAWKNGAPEWFRPLAALRQVKIMKDQLERELRNALMPFSSFSDNSVQGNERIAFSLASELVIPKLKQICSTLESFAEVWRWNRFESGPQHLTKDLESFYLRVQAFSTPGAVGMAKSHISSGSLGTTMQALQSVAESFVSFSCLRGRIAAAYYTNLAAQIARESNNLWEAGNGFAMVANCILGSPNSAHESSNGAEYSANVYRSIASLYLAESIAVFSSIGANFERKRIEDIVCSVENRRTRHVATELTFDVNHEAVSFYFLVGLEGDNAISSLSAGFGNGTPISIGLGRLNVVRKVLGSASSSHEDSRNGFTLAESLLIQEIQEGAQAYFSEGSLQWKASKEWMQNETSTLPQASLTLHADFQLHDAAKRFGNGSSTNDHALHCRRTFWVRRLWPVDLRSVKVGSRPRKQILRCPKHFVMLPNKLDKSSYTDEWMTDCSEDQMQHFRDGQIFPLDRVAFQVVDAPLSPLVAIAKLNPIILPVGAPPLSVLLDASPFGMPIGQEGETLGPLVESDPDRVQETSKWTPRGVPSFVSQQNSRKFFSDSCSECSTSPTPPSYPPPDEKNDRVFEGNPPLKNIEPIILLPPLAPKEGQDDVLSSETSENESSSQTSRGESFSSSHRSSVPETAWENQECKSSSPLGSGNQYSSNKLDISPRWDDLSRSCDQDVSYNEATPLSDEEKEASLENPGGKEWAQLNHLSKAHSDHPPLNVVSTLIGEGNQDRREGQNPGSRASTTSAVFVENDITDVDFSNPLFQNESYGISSEIDRDEVRRVRKLALRSLPMLKDFFHFKLDEGEYDLAESARKQGQLQMHGFLSGKNGLRECVVYLRGKRAEHLHFESEMDILDEDAANVEHTFQVLEGNWNANLLGPHTSNLFTLVMRVKLTNCTVKENSIPGVVCVLVDDPDSRKTSTLNILVEHVNVLLAVFALFK